MRHMVVRDLAERVGPVGHLVEVLYGPLVVLHGIEHRTGIEIVGTGHLGMGRGVIVLQGVILVPLDEVGLGNHAREALPALHRHVLEKGHSPVEHVVVVLAVELAVHQVEIGKLAETRVRSRLGEPGLSLHEAALGVVHIAVEIAGSGGEGVHRHGIDLAEEGPRRRMVAGRECAVAPLEERFRGIHRADGLGIDLGELRRGAGIVLGVEEGERALVMHLGQQGRTAVPGGIVRVDVRCIDRVQLECTEHRIAFGHIVSGQGLEQGPGPLIHSAGIKVQGLPVDAGTAVLAEGWKRRDDACRECGCHQYFHSHKQKLL